MNHIAPLLSPLLSRLKKVKSTGKNKWTACCCEFRFKLDTHSTANWTVIPEQTGQ